MNKILITESELIKLIETAMDLDRYVQHTSISTDNGNVDVEDSAEDIVDKLKELIYMMKSGKNINSELKSKIYKELDAIKSIYSDIKYES